MATTTPNFGWSVPTSTDLVKDGAVAIETLGDSIDASLVDLKGGTSGQVLSKNSNTDMDFTWVTSDDANAIQNAIVDAKGDLIAATAADTPARIAVGANNTVLTADSSTATGLKWAAPAGGGKVLQVVNATAGSYIASTSSTFADTGLTVTITPTLSTSKILVFVSQNGVSKENGNGQGRIRLMRDATQILSLGSLIAFTGNTDYAEIGSVSSTYLDNPATTSATTYKTQFATTAGSFALQNYGTSGDGTSVSTITLMEIGA